MINQGILRYKGRLIIPVKLKLVHQLLVEYHDNMVGGHAGVFKTNQQLAQEWFWPGMKKQIQQYVCACATCQHNETSSLSSAGLLQPLPILSKISEDISLDSMDVLPKSQGISQGIDTIFLWWIGEVCAFY